MSVEKYPRSCRELNDLCSQNGWIGNDTSAVHVEQCAARHIAAAVTFDEIIMEGTGAMAER